MKKLASICCSLLLATVSQAVFPANGTAEDRQEKISVKSEKFHVTPKTPHQKRFGALYWRGGVVLTSQAARFGGISGLLISEDGNRIVAVTDRGAWIKADLEYDQELLSGVKNLYAGPLLDKEGKPFLTKQNEDAEAISRSGNKFLVSFERNHRIGVFSAVDDRPDKLIGTIGLPIDSADMRRNNGIEALHQISGGPHTGKLAVFAERLLDKKGDLKGWLIAGDKHQPVYLNDIDGFSITDATSCKDGSLFVLERHYNPLSGVKMRLRYIEAGELTPNARLRGRILVSLGPDAAIDNMEGVAVHKNREGNIIITVISDDNFNPLQKTILMQFEYRGRKR